MSGKDEQPILVFDEDGRIERRINNLKMKEKRRKLEEEFENGGIICSGCLSRILNIDIWCMTCNCCIGCCTYFG